MLADFSLSEISAASRISITLIRGTLLDLQDSSSSSISSHKYDSVVTISGNSAQKKKREKIRLPDQR